MELCSHANQMIWMGVTTHLQKLGELSNHLKGASLAPRGLWRLPPTLVSWWEEESCNTDQAGLGSTARPGSGLRNVEVSCRRQVPRQPGFGVSNLLVSSVVRLQHDRAAEKTGAQTSLQVVSSIS
ncbi:hypothetical protein NDU88_005548 [Pleurodeles waltl]|uniref:Uncharacterized protein n=1 Tax=Pleurodeles waltl TaxID=8319 RepID=A0AAV7UJA0_PLEWA|nr:hypothetical protein NDU88_005548 [Pleurodeles waltl]